MMKKIAKLFFGLATLLMVLQAWASSEATVKAGQVSEVIKSPGTYKSASEKCQISLVISGKGGFTKLKLQSNKVVNDVTGVAYLSDDLLAYTTSPIYGSPGVFIYNCSSKRVNRVAGPKRVDKAYPQGSDYFELHSVEGRKIYFYYSPDVDKTNFDNFRTKDFLFEVLIDGSALQKTQ